MLVTCLEKKTNNLQLLSKWKYIKIFLVGHISGKISLLNCVPYVPACQQGLRGNVSACQCAKSVPTAHFYIPTCHTAGQHFNLVCQHAKRRASFSSIILTKCYMKFLYFIIIQKFYILLDIVAIDIICICVVNKTCVILHFHSSCHSEEK